MCFFSFHYLFCMCYLIHSITSMNRQQDWTLHCMEQNKIHLFFILYNRRARHLKNNTLNQNCWSSQSQMLLLLIVSLLTYFFSLFNCFDWYIVTQKLLTNFWIQWSLICEKCWFVSNFSWSTSCFLSWV